MFKIKQKVYNFKKLFEGKKDIFSTIILISIVYVCYFGLNIFSVLAVFNKTWTEGSKILYMILSLIIGLIILIFYNKILDSRYIYTWLKNKQVTISLIHMINIFLYIPLVFFETNIFLFLLQNVLFIGFSVLSFVYCFITMLIYELELDYKTYLIANRLNIPFDFVESSNISKYPIKYLQKTLSNDTNYSKMLVIYRKEVSRIMLNDKVRDNYFSFIYDFKRDFDETIKKAILNNPYTNNSKEKVKTVKLKKEKDFSKYDTIVNNYKKINTDSDYLK